MSLIEKIKDDCEIGTPGPYQKTLDHEWSLDTGGSNAYFVIAGPTGPFAIVAVEDAWAFDDQNEADQRRVCRLDQLEALAIMSKDLAEIVQAHIDATGGTDAERAALAAYREATA